jgi:outer membrane protein assembly factor BamE (lipoprotein component of BamABCDE complex)
MKKLLILIIAILVSGCATTSAVKFSQLQMGMSKEEVRKILGNPYLYRGAKDGQEVWEYTIYAPNYPKTNPWTSNITYWVTFIDNKLVFYGQPGDFGTSGPDTKKEIIIKER